jgi:hypothetical protein
LGQGVSTVREGRGNKKNSIFQIEFSPPRGICLGGPPIISADSYFFSERVDASSPLNEEKEENQNLLKILLELQSESGSGLKCDEKWKTAIALAQKCKIFFFFSLALVWLIYHPDSQS